MMPEVWTSAGSDTIDGRWKVGGEVFDVEDIDATRHF
jgi:hypothetical protein